MFIHEIGLKQFRNYRALRCSFEGRYNLLFGNNGQGKTNLLEAIYLCTHLRSFRSNSWQPLLQEGSDHFNARVLFSESAESRSQANDVFVRGDSNKALRATILLNGKPVKRDSMKPYQLNVLLLTNDDVFIAKASPYDRRRYFDAVLGLIKPEYSEALSSFYRVLLHRNADLRAQKSPVRWDDSLAQLGATLVNARMSFLRAIHRFLGRLFTELSGHKTSASIAYTWASRPLKGYLSSEQYLELLASSKSEDRRHKSTQFGPHRDDYVFWIGRRSVSEQASQGEMRLFAYALKFAIVEYITYLSKRAPLLLLDDIFSDLDPDKIKLFFRTIQGSSQVFLACANKNLIPKGLLPFKAYRIQSGRISPEGMVA